jgi:hypothetical protein
LHELRNNDIGTFRNGEMAGVDVGYGNIVFSYTKDV